MAKNIALFSDGTGNSSAKAQKTNVWRLFQALDQTGFTQIAKYDDGVGTSSNKYLAALGGAFGWGLKRNVIDLYKFVCRNYVAGDRIYGFGFSRGAFTIRVLVGLIAREGLVTFRSEEELDHNAAAAYRSFRYKAFPSKSPIVWFARRIRDFLLYVRNLVRGHSGYEKTVAATKTAERDQIPIRFLGLWDTVEAYGMPIPELKRAIDWALWPMLFGDMKLTSSVERAVHALSLDDERATFHPLLWDEEWEAELAQAQKARIGRITQVWFAGVHSNVGGGYPEDQLSLVPCEWIMSEAANNGLSFDADQVKGISAAKSPFARLYDSRAGLAAYYRYSPRQTPRLAYKGTPILANVHWSVLVRMAYGSDSYAPITLPHKFNVVTPSGGLEEIGKLLNSMRQETFATGDPQLDSAIKGLENPDHDEVGLVWDTVFWKRCLYALTMTLTAAAVAFPWLSKFLPGKLATAESAVRGPVSTIVDGLSAVIPSYAARWKESLTTYPLEFGLLLIGVGLTLVGSQTLESRIHDRARLVWHGRSTDKIKNYRTWREENRKGFGRIIMLWFILLVGVGIASYFYYGSQRHGPEMAFGFGLSAILLAIGYGISIIGSREKVNTSKSRVRSTLSLETARLIRENKLLNWLYAKLLNQIVIPAFFVAAIVVVGTVLANRAAFDVLSSAGLWCRDSDGVRSPGNGKEWEEKLQSSVGQFHTDDICWASGFVLKKNRRYTITITTDIKSPTDRWFDRDVPTDVIGFPTQGARYRIAAPLSRSWKQDWFKPIARIGRFGNDEYVLDPIKDVAPLRQPQPPPCLGGLRLPSGVPATTKIDSDLAKRINDCSPVPNDRLVLTSQIRPRSDGELFIYINDAVLGIPDLENLFFRNNSGTATVTVKPYSAAAASE
jgi:uncharacterized protein (DUF2235 family)